MDDTNSMTIATSSLPVLADQINDRHQQAIRHANDSLNSARECGERLIAAKQVVEHGKWLDWLSANCPTISERQAQRYMRVARNWPEIEAGCDGDVLSIDGALARIAESNPNTTLTTYLKEHGMVFADIPLPALGEMLIGIVESSDDGLPLHWIEIIPREKGDSYFVARIIPNSGIMDYWKKDALPVQVNCAVSRWSKSADYPFDISEIEWKTRTHKPLGWRYHPLCDTEEWWAGPNQNASDYWLTPFC